MRPSNPSSRSVAAAVPPAIDAPTMATVRTSGTPALDLDAQLAALAADDEGLDRVGRRSGAVGGVINDIEGEILRHASLVQQAAGLRPIRRRFHNAPLVSRLAVARLCGSPSACRVPALVRRP